MLNTDHDETFKQAETLCLEAVDNSERLPAYLKAHKAAQLLEHSGWRKKTGMTQNQIIMKHLLRAGSITVREAMVEYSIQSLTKRIQELREDGIDIVSVTKYHPVSRQKYVRYHLGIDDDLASTYDPDDPNARVALINRKSDLMWRFS